MESSSDSPVAAGLPLGTSIARAEDPASARELKRGAWSPEEDEGLRREVARHGARRWGTIAEAMGGKRSAKSCRMRWRNYLSPEVTNAPFTWGERRAIVLGVAQLGRRWAAISRRLRGRTDNQVKNYWNSSLKKHYVQILTQIREEFEEENNRNASVPDPPIPDFQQCLSSKLTTNSKNPFMTDTERIVSTCGAPLSQISCGSSNGTDFSMEIPVMSSKRAKIIPRTVGVVAKGRVEHIWNHDNFSSQNSPFFPSPTQNSNFLPPSTASLDGQTNFLTEKGKEKEDFMTENSLTELESLLTNLLRSSNDFLPEKKKGPLQEVGEKKLVEEDIITELFDNDFPLEVEKVENNSMVNRIPNLPQLHRPSIFSQDTNTSEIPDIVPQPLEVSCFDNSGFMNPNQGVTNPNWGDINNLCNKTLTENSTFEFSPQTNCSSGEGDIFSANLLSVETDFKNLISKLSGSENSPSKPTDPSLSAVNISGEDELSQIFQSSKFNNQERSNNFPMDAIENQTNPPVISYVKPENNFVPIPHKPTFQKGKNCEFGNPSSSLPPVSTFPPSLVSKDQSFTFWKNLPEN